MEGIAPFLIFLAIVLISIISSVVKGMREQQARQQRLRGRPGGGRRTGEYSAPASEVRKFLEAVRSGQPSGQGEQARAQGGEVPAAGAERAQNAPGATGALMDMIDRAIQERQKQPQGTRVSPAPASPAPVRRAPSAPAAKAVVRREPARARREEEAPRKKVAKRALKPAGKKAAPVAQRRAVATRGRGIDLKLASVPDLRRAVIYSEILGPPRALRPF